MATLATVALLAAGATAAIAEVTTPNPETLQAVGPASSEHGYPVWYQDSNNLRLEQCLDLQDPYCDPAFLMGEMPNPDAPISFPDNWPLESFYFQAGADMDMPGGGRAVLVNGLEATMANEATVDGDQVVFGRLRFDIDFPAGGTYEVVHPYGVDTFTVTDGEADDFRYVEDITPAPGNFALALKSRINPFLIREGGLIETPDGNKYVGDPAVPTRVTGSPHDTNVFRILSVAGDGTRSVVAETDLFSLMGKVSTNSGVAPDKAVLTESGSERFLDVFAHTDPGESLSVEGAGVVKTTLKADSGRYFARIPLGAASPAEVTVTNESDRPIASKTVPVTDGVVVGSAVYDTTAQELTVVATSTDEVDPPVLTLDGLTDSTGATVTLTDGTVTVPMGSPPATVTVSSSGGGSDSAPVTATGGELSTPAPTTAVITGDTVVTTGSQVTLTNASLNSDSVTWAQTGGTDVAVSGQTTGSVTFTAPDTAEELTFTLTATGPGGTHTSAPFTVSVLSELPPPPPPATPVAVATASPSSALAGQQVTVSAADSTGAETYSWSQTGGTTVQFDATASSFTFPMPQTAEPLTFQLTVASAAGGTSDPVTVSVTPVVDELTVTSAQFRADKREWRISGTASVTQTNTVTVYLQNADGTKGAVVGSGPVAAPVAPATVGDWSVRARGGVLPPAGVTRLVVESSRGGELTGVPFTRR